MTRKPGSATQQPLRGLYAITDERLIEASRLASAVKAAISGGARLIQFRDKNPSSAARTQLAAGVQAVCAAHGVTLIINDDIDLCKKIGAAGVHLGADDSSLKTAREQLGTGALIGISCYNQLDLALNAEQNGADYVAFGSFYSSGIKPDAVRADTEMLKRARNRLSIPIVAIGGITRANTRPLIDAGADMVAVISDVFGSDDIQAAAQEFSRLFDL
ncbi:MAG TPA: thiamine phosphate synthase [Gammaproteobacteria bacterium]|nr:thiamine phosphate synthase [Gammaproteobacteria bacterium]